VSIPEATPQPLSAPIRAARRGFTHESPGKSVEWYTPSWVFDRLGMTFDLDVCSPGAEKTSVPATRHYTIVDDGLTSPWFGTVWMNPPYTGIRPWTQKLAAHGDGIALVFARTDTAWFQEAAASATLLCFVARRISFINGDTGRPAGSPGTGSVLIAFGDKAADAVRMAGFGLCVECASID
jgi:phage N-6-adenine-methyltransferase